MQSGREDSGFENRVSGSIEAGERSSFVAEHDCGLHSRTGFGSIDGINGEFEPAAAVSQDLSGHAAGRFSIHGCGQRTGDDASDEQYIIDDMKNSAACRIQIVEGGGRLKGPQRQTLKITVHDGAHGGHIQSARGVHGGHESFDNHGSRICFLIDHKDGVAAFSSVGMLMASVAAGWKWSLMHPVYRLRLPLTAFALGD
jgi:hypothetical protein